MGRRTGVCRCAGNPLETAPGLLVACRRGGRSRRRVATAECRSAPFAHAHSGLLRKAVLNSRAILRLFLACATPLQCVAKKSVVGRRSPTLRPPGGSDGLFPLSGPIGIAWQLRNDEAKQQAYDQQEPLRLRVLRIWLPWVDGLAHLRSAIALQLVPAE